MKTSRLLLASLLTLLATGLRAAAPSVVISVQEVHTADPTAYTTWLSKTNEVAKTKLGIDRYYRSYLGVDAGPHTGKVFNVQAAENFTTLLTRGAALEKDPDLLLNSRHYVGLRTLADRSLYRAVRYEGANVGAHLYHTYVVVTDNAAYLKSIDRLRVLFDANGMKDVFINIYQVAAGRTDHTHMVSLNVASAEKLGQLLDALASPWLADWLAQTAPLRTVVRSATYREITK